MRGRREGGRERDLPSGRRQGRTAAPYRGQRRRRCGVEAPLAAPAGFTAALRGPARVVYGDLQPGNALTADRRLAAVIDFGCTGLADPAVDLIAAWYLLTAGARETFRTAVGADDASWARGRGWALSIALLELAHYRETNPVTAEIAAHVIDEILGKGRRTPGTEAEARGGGGFSLARQGRRGILVGAESTTCA
ncbi:phosphotransferase [Streptomyces sp. NPDC006270]|uniref:phosphotransferase n=1 Tax=Streptomyces sp. NPDC006270 TaxID=3364741 RepID=UPI00367B2B74